MTLVIPHSACPTAFVGMKPSVDPTSGETRYNEDYQHTRESCGTDACADAISRIDDAVLSDMKTGLTVRVSIFIPD